VAPVIGLAVGRGTGPELATLFERVLAGITDGYSAGIRTTRSKRIYHSYFSLKADAGIERVRELTREDADHYAEFCRTRAALGVPAIFRTAIKGFHITALTDRTVSRHLPDADIPRFMAVLYGAHLTTGDHPWAPPAGEEDACQVSKTASA
jgi:hypothetical protein